MPWMKIRFLLIPTSLIAVILLSFAIDLRSIDRGKIHPELSSGEIDSIVITPFLSDPIAVYLLEPDHETIGPVFLSISSLEKETRAGTIRFLHKHIERRGYNPQRDRNLVSNYRQQLDDLIFISNNPFSIIRMTVRYAGDCILKSLWEV